MIELTLVRHAKSDWGDPELDDHDRPLNARGLRDAPMMARRLADSGVRVSRILASTALRARTTAAIFGEELGAETELDGELYLAPASRLLAAAAGSGSTAVMVVAHDPGMSHLAAQLSDDGIAHMPTCAVAHFVWDADSWAAVGRRPADTWTLHTPR